MARKTLPRILTPSRKPIVGRLIVIGVMQSVVVLCIAAVVAQVAQSQPPFNQTALIFALVALGLGAYRLKIEEHGQAERLGQDYVRKVRDRLFGHLLNTQGREQSHGSHGLNMQRLITDLNSLKQWVSNGYARVLTATILCVVCLVALSWMDLFMGLALLSGALMTGYAALHMRRSLEGTTRAARRTRGRISRRTSDALLKIDTVRSGSAASHVKKRVRRLGIRLARQQEDRQRRVAGIKFLTEFSVPFLLMVVILSKGGNLTATSLTTLLVLGGMFQMSYRQLLSGLVYWTAFRIGQEKLGVALSQSADRDQPRLEDRKSCDDTIQNPEVMHPGQDLKIVRDAGSITRVHCNDRLVLTTWVSDCLSRNPSYVEVGGASQWLLGTVKTNLSLFANGISTRQIVKLCQLSREELGINALNLHRRPDSLRARCELARALVSQPEAMIITHPWLLSEPGMEILLSVHRQYPTTLILAGDSFMHAALPEPCQSITLLDHHDSEADRPDVCVKLKTRTCIS